MFKLTLLFNICVRHIYDHSYENMKLPLRFLEKKKNIMVDFGLVYRNT